MKKIVTVIFICLIVLKLGIGGQSIHESAKKGDIEKIKSMIKENPELIFLQNRYGMIPLHTSAYNGKIEVFEFFLKKGVDLNSATRTGKTALFYAEINQQKNMIAFLESKGLKKKFMNFPRLIGKYLEQKKPGRQPELFAPGIVSTIGMQHGSIAFTPDQKEVY